MGFLAGGTYIASGSQVGSGIIPLSSSKLTLYGSDVTGGSGAAPWTSNQTGASVGNHIDAYDGTAQNNYLTFSAYLNAGTYTFDFWGRQYSNAGIMTMQIDTVDQGISHDWYNAASSFDNKVTDTGIVIATSGVKTIKLIGATKNGASGGYALFIQMIQLTKTA